MGPSRRYLTRREEEVARELLTGKSGKEIAISLNISLRTLKTHLTRMYKKYDVSNRQRFLYQWHMEKQQNDAELKRFLPKE